MSEVIPIQNFVQVNIRQTPTLLSEINANNLLLITTETPSNIDTYRTYLNARQVGLDYGTNSETYALASVIFSQSPNILTGNGKLIVAPYTSATSATINALRLAFQTQKLLERDARGGTRYTEIVRSHFGVISPDARLQRPEYLGGSSQRINISPIAQTSGTSASGTTTPMGTLAAMAQVVSDNNSWMQSFTEHGVILGLVSVRADLTYQQGVPRMFSRTTRYSYYMPVFCSIGEQSVLNKEIYSVGSATGAIS